MTTEVDNILEWAKVLIPIATAIGAAIVSYRSAVKKFAQTTKDSDKSIFVTTVTQERAIWRSELREQIALYTKLAYGFLDGAGDISELTYHKTHLLMRINPLARKPTSKHEKDHAFYRAVVSVYSLCEKPQVSNVKLKVALNKLEQSGQELLNQEWKKSKNEAETGCLS
ncbi:hypothetical protein MOU86_004588 [Vibrio parahaemolyticus]|nr:hypothetical protein [Vibrio parahaemolyticus]